MTFVLPGIVTRTASALGFFCCVSVAWAQPSPIFKMDGKPYTTADLSAADQQSFFEVQLEHYERMKSTIENSILSAHIAEEAKKKGKSIKDMETELFSVKDPTEKEMKEWYEKNKARIPYPLEQIKGQVVQFLNNEKVQEKRKQLLKKVSDSKKVEILLTKPVAPKVEANIQGLANKGKDGAKVTIVEFADYQCPHCKMAAPLLRDAVNKHKDKVKFVFADFPLGGHDLGVAVAEGAHCAGEQGKFWEYHYMAFEKQETFDKEAPTKFAKDLKLDDAKFKACLAGGTAKTIVEKGKQEGERIGVSGTPFILINGTRYMGAHSVEAFNKAIEEALK